MKLYVANCTRQVCDFHYKTIETKGARQQKIPPGQQILISGDLNRAEIDLIVRSHEKYGLIPVDQVKSYRNYIPRLYSIDKQISPADIELAMRKNTNVLIFRGKEARKLAAITANNAIQSTMEGLREQTRGQIQPPDLRQMEMEVEQVSDIRAPFVPSEETPAPITEGIRVTKEAEQDPPRSGRGSGRRRAA